jgi:hypothetical protein
VVFCQHLPADNTHALDRRVPRPCSLRKVDFPRRTSELHLIALPHIFRHGRPWRPCAGARGSTVIYRLDSMQPGDLVHVTH